MRNAEALLGDYRFEPDLARAATLPAAWYRGAEMLALEKERIFARTWQAVGRTAEVARPGDFFTCDVLGEPLVITHGTDGVLRGFYNVCRHRAGNVAAGKGNRKALQCRYHGWTYGLDGRLTDHARSSRGWRTSRRAAYGLLAGAGGDVGAVRLRQPGPERRAARRRRSAPFWARRRISRWRRCAWWSGATM